LVLCTNNFNIPSPKSRSPKKEPAPKAHRPVLNWCPAASPHANRLARPPHFPGIFKEEDVVSDAVEDYRYQSPTPVTRRKKPRSTSSASQLHVPAPSSSSPPLLQAPIAATIQVDIDESLLKQNKKRISRRQSSPITVGSGNSSSGSTSSSTRAARHPPFREPLAPCSARHYGGTLDLRKRKKSTQRSMETGELIWMRM
jgi:hypothetical protein